MPNIIGKKWLFLAFSGLVIIPGTIAMLLWGIKPGIDFTGGTILEFRMKDDKVKVTDGEVRKITSSQKLEMVSIQSSGKQSYLLKLKPIDKDQNQKLQNQLSVKFGPVEELSFETVGPTIGKETTRKAIYGVIVASVAIIIYISLAFRKIPKPYSAFRFGVSAVAALIHDVLLVLGLFAIFGHYLGVEVDSLFITALLTVMGFSVHDSIVVFDRIRENLGNSSGESFEAAVNKSLVQTLARSLSTSLTVVFTLVALLLFGGETIRWFIIALLIGVISGTYSSIFNAAPILVIWEEKTKKGKSEGKNALLTK